ncbi:MAG: acyl carrier protein [Actinophytocola sp.]|uniref:acyl carrier protein n=1 Tax=Actinophytocola sp. TaxID=1872138 RepID=UPI003C773FD2
MSTSVVNFAALVAEVLDVDPAEITENADQDALPGWTSMRHIQLVVTLEEAYRVYFDYAEIRDARTIAGLRKVLRTKGIEV